MGFFHTHNWKEIARTYSPPVIGKMSGYIHDMNELILGVTTILRAIIKKMPKKVQKLPSGNYSEDYVNNYIRTEVSRNKTIDEFESVIKEVLQTK